MIADLDETIKAVLKAELPIKNGEIDVKFDQPKREWSAKLTRPTVNFFLYDVRENAVLRRHQWEQLPNGGNGNGNGRDNLARMKRTPFRLDCHYMLTVWASEPEDEHRLLSRCLLALFRHPVLPEERMVGAMKQQPYDVQARLANHDKLTNPAEVWSALDNEMRPSISYVVTIALDPWTEVTGPVVRTFVMRTGQSTSLPRYNRLDEGGADPEMTFIGGTIRQSKDHTPQPNIEVAIKGTGWIDKTDEQGRFALGSLPPGDYTLIAWPSQGKPKEKKISVPTGEGNYDLEL
jgi:hypothetical protein